MLISGKVLLAKTDEVHQNVRRITVSPKSELVADIDKDYKEKDNKDLPSTVGEEMAWRWERVSQHSALEMDKQQSENHGKWPH